MNRNDEREDDTKWYFLISTIHFQQILREAKEKTEEAEKNLKIMHKQQYKKQLHFETLFDDYHGKKIALIFVLSC